MAISADGADHADHRAGRRIDYDSSAIFEMRDGKIAYVRTYIPTGYILEQLGVSPGSEQAAGAVAAST